MSEAERMMEAKARYIGGEITLAELARESGLPLSTLKKRCKAENWVREKEKAQKRAMRKAVTGHVNRRARELKKLMDASDDIEDALRIAAKAFSFAFEAMPTDVVDSKNRAANLSSITAALARQTETRMLLNGILAAADREKLDLLRRKAELEERKEKMAQDKSQNNAVFELAGETEALGE